MTTTSPAAANLFIGPRSFETGERLFGRDREVRDLLHLLIAERIVLLYSPSGAGKSSLIKAALIPALEKKDFVPLPPIRVNQELPPDTPPGANRYIYSTLVSLEERFAPDERLELEELAALVMGGLVIRAFQQRQELALQAGPARVRELAAQASDLQSRLPAQSLEIALVAHVLQLNDLPGSAGGQVPAVEGSLQGALATIDGTPLCCKHRAGWGCRVRAGRASRHRRAGCGCAGVADQRHRAADAAAPPVHRRAYRAGI